MALTKPRRTHETSGAMDSRSMTGPFFEVPKYDWIVGFGVFFLLSVVQFGALPNALFAPSARRRRLNYFMRRLHALGLDKYNDVSVDSVKDQLIFPEHQQQGKRARSSDARD
jgi:hypothetical protein